MVEAPTARSVLPPPDLSLFAMTAEIRKARISRNTQFSRLQRFFSVDFETNEVTSYAT